MPTILAALLDPAKPVFLFGSTPPREGTSEEKARETCAKFAARSAVLATDGFIVYDIQDEGTRTTMERPFPFRKTMDPALYASFFPPVSGKECVVYKSVVEDSEENFDKWLDQAIYKFGHRAFNLVGAPSSSSKHTGVTLADAGRKSVERNDSKFGCVCIPERHMTKGNEHQNLLRKSEFGAEWFITQGIFATGPLIQLLRDYSALCKEQGVLPKKMILTFAPCGRAKTMTFVKWLGMHVPEDVEKRIFDAANPVQESINIHCESLVQILEATATLGIPLGINVESLSIFKEEIDAAHELFQRLQLLLLNSYKRHWTIRWYFVDQPLVQVSTPSLHGSSVDLAALSDILQNENRRILASSSSNLAGQLTPPTASTATTPVVPPLALPAAEKAAEEENQVVPANNRTVSAFPADTTSAVAVSSLLVLAGVFLGRLSAQR